VKVAQALTGVRRLCIDTAPFIYFIERHPDYVELMRTIFRVIEESEDQVVTSPVTITEVLSKPIQAKDTELIKSYRELLLDSEKITIESISTTVAEKAAT
jgi:predicted nucleic acid-binding protein